MNAEIICVGNEVLNGSTVNTNASFLGSELSLLGINVLRNYVVSDNLEEICNVLGQVQSDIVILTGGLGPTVDDITRESLSAYLNKELYIDEEALEMVKAYFIKTNKVMVDTNNKQANVIKGGTVLVNERGTAPGLYIEDSGKHYFLLPGPPMENKHVFEKVRTIISTFIDKEMYIDGYKLIGIGESDAESMLKGFYDLHKNVYIAPYAAISEIKYMFSSYSKNSVIKCMKEFTKLFSKYIIGNYSSTLEESVCNLLVEKDYKISFAESCTGGLAAATIINYPGASKCINQSYVTYSNQSKIDILDVNESTINRFGVVSNECASEMSIGLYKATGSNVCVSITGIAGPTGGTDLKPVGMVYFCIYINNEIYLYNRVFTGIRNVVRQKSVKFILNELRYKLLNYK